MKISGYGPFSKHGGGKSSNQKSVIFRKRYRLGQKLQGKLIKWERQNLGWIEIHDLTLLAQIDSDPSVGAILFFKVEQLYPEIILKELYAGGNGYSFSDRTPQSVTSDFISARAKFESQSFYLFSRQYELSKSYQSQFYHFLKSDTKHARNFLNVIKSVANLNSFSQPVSKILYMPWLIPSGQNHEALITVSPKSTPAESFYDGLFYFSHPATGSTRLKIMFKDPSSGFKLISSKPIPDKLNKFYEIKNPRFLGYETIARDKSGGILMEFLSSLSTF